MTPLTAACKPSLSITNSQSLLKLMLIESVVPYNCLILCCPLLLLPSILPSIRVFSSESVLRIRWPSIRVSASASILPMTVQYLFPLGLTGSISLLSKDSQKPPTHSLKASILWHSAFFMVQHSHPYMTTGKTIALTRRTFVNKVIFLLLNMLTSFVITFLPRSKCLLISWLLSLSSLIFGAQENKICYCFHFFPIYFL